MTSLYLEQLLESVDSLPEDLRRNFELVRELDVASFAELGELEASCQEFLADVATLDARSRAARLRQLQESFKKALDLGDNKVSIAIQTYETVDKHIRQLDEDLVRFEEEAAASFGRDALRDSANGGGSYMGDDAGEAVEDMPVDPNEPTYCLCHQVSYGEMIACDNPDCPTEWFHFACVMLQERPRGKWYCPRCRPEMESRKKR